MPCFGFLASVLLKKNIVCLLIYAYSCFYITKFIIIINNKWKEVFIVRGFKNIGEKRDSDTKNKLLAKYMDK